MITYYMYDNSSNNKINQQFCSNDDDYQISNEFIKKEEDNVEGFDQIQLHEKCSTANA